MLCLGCACDIPSHSYQYSFDPNPHWSAFYAPATEICAYLQGIADKYGVMRYVKLSHKLTNCKWDDQAKKWYGHAIGVAWMKAYREIGKLLSKIPRLERLSRMMPMF